MVNYECVFGFYLAVVWVCLLLVFAISLKVNSELNA